jgi:hypothetical protein
MIFSIVHFCVIGLWRGRTLLEGLELRKDTMLISTPLCWSSISQVHKLSSQQGEALPGASRPGLKCDRQQWLAMWEARFTDNRDWSREMNRSQTIWTKCRRFKSWQLWTWFKCDWQKWFATWKAPLSDNRDWSREINRSQTTCTKCWRFKSW